MLVSAFLILLVVVAVAVVARWYFDRPDPVDVDWVEEQIDGRNAPADPFGAGFANARDFLMWAESFRNTIYLDGALVAAGVEPAVYFVSRENGRVTLK